MCVYIHVYMYFFLRETSTSLTSSLKMNSYQSAWNICSHVLLPLRAASLAWQCKALWKAFADLALTVASGRRFKIRTNPKMERLMITGWSKITGSDICLWCLRPDKMKPWRSRVAAGSGNMLWIGFGEIFFFVCLHQCDFIKYCKHCHVPAHTQRSSTEIQ